MAEVAVTIAGRAYRLACDEDDEARLGDLAALVDATIVRMRESFGAIGDQRLTIMAAISLADELADATSRIRELEAELGDLTANLADIRECAEETSRQRAEDTSAERLAVSLDEAADRIERIAADLDTSNEDLRREDQIRPD